MARVRSTHHVLGLEGLLPELRNNQSSMLLRAIGRRWRKARREEVEPWERGEIHRNLPRVAVKLSRNSQACGHNPQRCAHSMVQITVSWRSELECAEADVMQGLIVQQHAFISVFHQLMETQHRVVRLNDGIQDFGRRHDGEGLLMISKPRSTRS